MQVWWKSVDIYSSYCPEKKFRCTTGGTYNRWTDIQQTWLAQSWENRKISLHIYFLTDRKNLLGTQNRVWISHGKPAIIVGVVAVLLYFVHSFGASLSLAQLDACLTGDPRHVWKHSFMEIDHGHSLPSAYSRRAVVSFWQKNVHKYW